MQSSSFVQFQSTCNLLSKKFQRRQFHPASLTRFERTSHIQNKSPQFLPLQWFVKVMTNSVYKSQANYLSTKLKRILKLQSKELIIHSHSSYTRFFFQVKSKKTPQIESTTRNDERMNFGPNLERACYPHLKQKTKKDSEGSQSI